MKQSLLLFLLLISGNILWSQPPNDNPCGAIAIPLAESPEPCIANNYSITGATFGNQNIPSDGGTTNPDVWYTFTSPVRSDVSINIFQCGILYSIYSATACNGFFSLEKPVTGCNEPTNDVTITVTPGALYYLRIRSVSNTGNFSFPLCINTYLPPASQRIGLHTSLPTENVDIAGPVRFRALASFNKGLKISTANLSFSGSDRVLTGDAFGNVDWRSLSSLPGTWKTNGSNIYFSSGNAGIGLNNPSNRLSVSGNADISGNLGLGTTNPQSRLEVVAGPSPSPTKLLIANRGGFGPAALEFISDYGLGSQWRPGFISSNDLGSFTGRLEFFTNGTGSNNLYGEVKGLEVRNGAALTATGTVGSYSDVRLKQDIRPFTDGLKIIEQITPVAFQYKPGAPFPSENRQVGVLAQDLERAAPYMVHQVNESGIPDLRWVDNQAYVFLLINSVKTLQQQVRAQQQQIDSLTKKLEQIVEKRK